MLPGVLGKKYPAALAVAVLLAALLAGCGGSSGAASAGGSGGSPRPGGTLNVALSEELLTLDPQAALYPNETWAVAQVSEPLWREDPQGQLVPWLITNVKTSKEDRVWTLTLKSGIKFSNGQPMTSADVLFTLDRARKSKLWEELLEGITNVQAPSPSTIVITNAKPAPELPTLLSQWSFGIGPKNFGGESPTEFASKPIGTGPFMVSTWKRGESLTLRKNPYYWTPNRPYLDTVVLQTIPNANSRVSQLDSGAAGLAYQPPWSQVEAIAASSETQFRNYPLGFEKHIILNGRAGLFTNPKAREAVNLALDRKGMLKTVLHGHGQVAGSLVAPATEFYDASLKAPEHNAARAKELLTAAVHEGVNPNARIVLPIEDDFWPEAIQIAQQNLEEVGFKVAIQKVDLSTSLELAAAGKFEIGPGFQYTPLSTPLEIWAYYNVSKGWNAGIPVNETQKLAREAQTRVPKEERAQLNYKLQEILAKEHYVIPVVYAPFSWANRTSVQGFKVGKNGIPWLSEVWVSN